MGGRGAIVMPMMPALHPRMPEREPKPGLLVKNYGAVDVAGFLLAHLAHGLVVGFFYAALT